MISDFVILMTLARTERAADFIVSRFSRLYPAYWASIALTLVVLWAFPNGQPALRLIRTLYKSWRPQLVPLGVKPDDCRAGQCDMIFLGSFAAAVCNLAIMRAGRSTASSAPPSAPR
jgi:hypothetical protein